MTRTRRVPCPQDTRGTRFFKKIRIKINKKMFQASWAGAGDSKKVKKIEKRKMVKRENKKLERAWFNVYIKVRENFIYK